MGGPYRSEERAELTRDLCAMLGMREPADVGTERALLSAFGVLQGVVAEYRDTGDQIAEEALELVVSAGHAEYMVEHEGVEVAYVWQPLSDEVDAELSRLVARGMSPSREAAAALLFAELTSAVQADALEAAGVDLTWETVVRLRGAHCHLVEWLERLRVEISEPGHGDDDLYDYWPSGVRLAAAVAERLGEEQVALTKGVVTVAVTERGLDSAEFNFGSLPGPWPDRAVTLEVPYGLTTLQLVLEPIAGEPEPLEALLADLVRRMAGDFGPALREDELALIFKAA